MQLNLPTPQVIVLHCSLWDLSRIWQSGDFLVPKSATELPAHTLHDWMANFTSLVQFAQLTFGRTVHYGLRTSAYHNAPGLFGPIAFQAQMNAATRQVALSLGLALFDQVLMTAQAKSAADSLRDDWHPNALHNAEVINIYFNYARQLMMHARPDDG